MMVSKLVRKIYGKVTDIRIEFQSFLWWMMVSKTASIPFKTSIAMFQSFLWWMMVSKSDKRLSYEGAEEGLILFFCEGWLEISYGKFTEK